MAAVASLSLIVPGVVTQEIIDSEQLRRLLQAIPTAVSIAEDRAEGLLVRKKCAARELYESIREFQGMGWARTSKLLAAKRPRLIPIRDSVVQRKLGASTMWWQSMLEEWSGSDLPDAVTRVRAKCRNLPAYVTTCVSSTSRHGCRARSATDQHWQA